jgi:hypothetical protein
MKQVIIFFACALLFVTVHAPAEDALIVGLHLEKGQVSLITLEKSPAYYTEPAITPETGYRVELVSFTGKQLYSRTFLFPTTLSFQALPIVNIPEEEIRGGEITLDTASVELILPTYPNAANLIVYDPENQEVLEASLAQFANVCGDSICQEHESFRTCSEDCEQTRVPFDTDTTPISFNFMIIAGIIAVGILGLLIIMFIIQRGSS